MGYGTRPEDFTQASRLKKNPQERGLWWVCRGYRADGNKIVALSPDPITTTEEAFAVYEDGSDGWMYLPLEDEPDLFLKFARLQRARDFRASALDFCSLYGVTGFVRRPESGEKQRGAVAGIGATEITFDRIWEESRLAWAVLRLYETARDGNGSGVPELLTRYGDVLGQWPLYLRERELLDHGLEGSEATWIAMRLAAYATGEMVNLLCHLGLHVSTPSSVPLGVTEGWTFRNLLGAMYLQMFWLMASGEDLARCGHCRSAMSLGHANPDGRKRRRDKRYCDDACRQAHHRNKKRSGDKGDS